MYVGLTRGDSFLYFICQQWHKEYHLLVLLALVTGYSGVIHWTTHTDWAYTYSSVRVAYCRFGEHRCWPWISSLI